MLLALVFVPEEDVLDCFDKVRGVIPEDFLQVMDYFEETYVVGRRARGRRRAVPARYLIQGWNQYTATIRNEQRTNNISEGWHNRFAVVVGKHHPDLYSMLTEFQKRTGGVRLADTETHLAEYAQGKTVRPNPKRKWITTQKRIRLITLEYERYKEENKREDYLRTLDTSFPFKRYA